MTLISNSGKFFVNYSMEENVRTHKVTLYNDDEHSFEFVIASLIKFCDHTLIQAEQCATTTDAAGKCDIFSGKFNEVFDTKLELDNLGLKVDLHETIESDMH